VSFDEQVIRAMEPGHRYEVTRLAVALRSDYSRTFFALSRLYSWGFVDAYDVNEFELTELGEKLQKLLLAK